MSLTAISITSLLLIDRSGELGIANAAEGQSQDLRVLADSVSQILWGTRADGHCDYLNARYQAFTGIEVAVAIKEQLWTAPIHPDDRPDMYRAWRYAIDNDCSEFRAYGRVRNRRGDYVWMHSVGRAIRSPETGEIVRWYGSLLDVDAEFLAQETIRNLNKELQQVVDERTQQLEQTEWRFRTLFDDPNIGVLELDLSAPKQVLDDLQADGIPNVGDYLRDNPDELDSFLVGGRIVDSNQAFVRMLGYTDPSELSLKSAFQSDPGAQELVLKQLQAFEDGRDWLHGNTVIAGADGKRIAVAYSIRLRTDGTTYTTFFDISERERAHELMLGAQQELARANRLSTVGALSISIVHELNQPVLSMSLDIATGTRTLKKTGIHPEIFERLFERLRENSHRLTEIIKRTRDNITNHPRALQPIDVVGLARSTMVLLEREFVSHGAEISLRASRSIPSVWADRIELQQVLVNLIVNALEAMASTQIDKREIEISIGQLTPGQISVSVTDTGPGIAQDDLGRVFEPFFTTKSEGIGVGLEICRSTVEALGGKISVSNAPVHGAIFEFWLPTGHKTAEAREP
jgi:PAS domain S-box-containing protein